MWLSNVRTPVSSSDGDDRELGDDDSTSDGGSDFLGALDTESDVSKHQLNPKSPCRYGSPVRVTDSNGGLESGSLTGRGLLLDGSNAHDLVLEGGEEDVDDLVLFDGQREEVDLLHRLDLSILDQSTEFGNGDPIS